MSLLDSVTRFMGLSRKRERLDLGSMRRVGTSKTHKTCQACGKTKLQKTHVFERSDGARVYLGSECAQAHDHGDSAVLASGFARMPPRMSVEDFKKKFPGWATKEETQIKELYNWNGYGMIVRRVSNVRQVGHEDVIGFSVWDQYAKKIIENYWLKYDKTPLGEIVVIDKRSASGPTKIMQSWLDTFPKWDPIKEHVSSASATPAPTVQAGLRVGQAGADLSSRVLTYNDYSQMNMSAAKFDRSNISDANFSRADLTDASLKYVIAVGTDFTGADLDYADFSGSILVDASFRNAIATHANFRGADFVRADFTGADLEGASFSILADMSANTTMKDWWIDSLGTAHKGWPRGRAVRP